MTRLTPVGDGAANPVQRIGVAVTTIGRWDELRNLLEDLSNQTQPPHAVAVAHHDADDADDLERLVRTFADGLTIRTVLSPAESPTAATRRPQYSATTSTGSGSPMTPAGSTATS